MAFEVVKSGGPEDPVRRQPSLDIGQRVRHEDIATRPRHPPLPDQPRAPENPQMPRHRGPADGKPTGDFARRQFPALEEIENGSASRVGDRTVDG